VGECGDINYYYWSRKEKELFNWLKCPAVVLRTYCMPGTSKKGRNKEMDWSRKVHEKDRTLD